MALNQTPCNVHPAVPPSLAAVRAAATDGASVEARTAASASTDKECAAGAVAHRRAPSKTWSTDRDSRPQRGIEPPRPAAAFDLDIGVIYTHEDAFMDRLLTTARASARGLRARLILVDNVSRGGVEAWRTHFADCSVVRNAKRLHYAANLNRILASSTARYVLLLNTDMYFEPREQCLAKMVRFMDVRPECGLAGCRLLHADGEHAPSARRFQRLSTIVARRCGFGPLLPHALDRYLYRDRQPTDTFACEWLSGCFLLVRRETHRAVGGFDERFLKYFEDVDYCLRVARCGWHVTYHGATYCYHLEQRASYGLLSRDARLHLSSYARFLGKWGFNPSASAGPPARKAA